MNRKDSPAAMGESYCSQIFKLEQDFAELSPEEMSHFVDILQKPESVSGAKQALEDYIRIIREESSRRSGVENVDPLLAAKDKFKFKKGYGGKNP